MQTEGPVATLARRYVLQEELGRSGTGVLWRAHDTVLDRTVAVKVLRPALSDDPAVAARVASDVGAAARVTAPGLVAILDSGVEEGVTFVVREHVEGESLRARIARAGRLPPSEAIRIGEAALRALGVAHRHGLVHGDLKPENVLLGAGGDVRLSDLGIGAAVRAARPAEAREILAPAPEPPELASGRPPDPRADVFGAGALLFEALTGRSPDGRRAPRDLVRDVPRELDLVVARALDADPESRFADAESFAQALVAVSAVDRSQGPPEAHGLRAWLLVPALVIAAVAVAIAVGLWAGRLEIGGPLGVRVAEPERPRPSPRVASPDVAIRVVSAAAFDPFGDGSENDSTVPGAIDGDPATAWRSENYFDADLRKPGVGLLLDLGRARTVTGFRLVVPHPGWRFGVAVGDDPSALAREVEPVLTAGASMERALAPATGRYVLVWIVTVVDAGDGNRAEIAEIEVLGPDA